MVVYRITNKLNGKQYIGQTTSPMRVRFAGHCSEKSGTISAIKSAIQKYGKENFSHLILSECSSQEELNNAEIYWIDYYQTVSPNGYNISLGGFGGGKHSTSAKLKMSLARKGIQKPNKNSWPSTPIVCIETGTIYPSINKAAISLGLFTSNVQKVVSGERKHTGGYTFRAVIND